jgi:DNA repair photolyase
MINTGFLYAKDNNRIFINSCLGCAGGCKYCYLGKMGYDNNSKLKVKKAEEILSELNQSGLEITEKTLITLGCFSECWDEENKPETIKLIKYFLQNGNQIQLSTKKEITPNELAEIQNLIKYHGQLVIFISSATISKHSVVEPNTDEPQKRFRTFRLTQELDIPVALYIKPVLQGDYNKRC